MPTMHQKRARSTRWARLTETFNRLRFWRCYLVESLRKRSLEHWITGFQIGEECIRLRRQPLQIIFASEQHLERMAREPELLCRHGALLAERIDSEAHRLRCRGQRARSLIPPKRSAGGYRYPDPNRRKNLRRT